MPALVWANQERVSLMVWGWASLQHLKAGTREVHCHFLLSWRVSAASRLSRSQARNRVTAWVRAWMSKCEVFTQGPIRGEWPLYHQRRSLETVEHLQITPGLLSYTPGCRTARLCVDYKGFLGKFKCSWWGQETSEKVAAGVCGTLYSLLTTACLGGRMAPRHGTSPAWSCLSMFMKNILLWLAWEEQLGRVHLEGAFAKLLNF